MKKIKKKQYNKNYKDKYPWMKSYSLAKQRCNNPNNNNRYYLYGYCGIKFLMTKEDFEYLWFRDKAYNLNRPSIHRIDSNGNYELSNCRFIELSENSIKSKPILQYDLNEYSSITNASKKTGIILSSISKVCRN